MSERRDHSRIISEKSDSSFAPSHSFCRCTRFWRATPPPSRLICGTLFLFGPVNSRTRYRASVLGLRISELSDRANGLWCARQLGAPRARCLQRKFPFTAHAFRAFSLDGYYTLNYGERVSRGVSSWIHTDSCSLTDRPPVRQFL